MKSKVLRDFIDKNTMEPYHVGDIYESEDGERMAFLHGLGYLNEPPAEVEPAKKDSNEPPAEVEPAEKDSNEPPAEVEPAEKDSNEPPAEVEPVKKTRKQKKPPAESGEEA